MGEFVAILLGLPTVLFTVPLALSVLYWLSVVAGALDLDVLDGVGGADGALDGALGGADGAVDGLGAFDGADGAWDGALDGADAAFDAGDAADALGDAASSGLDPRLGGPATADGLNLIAAVLTALRLTKVPLTVSLSFIVLAGWLLCFVGARHLLPLLPLPAVLGQGAVAAGALLGGTLLASLAVRPMEGLFHQDRARSKRELIGHTVTVTTGQVTARMGQAEWSDRAHHFILQVRDRREQGLARGDQALLIAYDGDAEAFVVEKLDLPGAGGDPARARVDAIRRVRARRAAR